MFKSLLLFVGLLAMCAANKVPHGRSDTSKGLRAVFVKEEFDPRGVDLLVSALIPHKKAHSNLSERSLFARQTLECPIGTTDCGAGTDLCCESGTTCRVELDGCCPLTAKTCGGFACTDAGNVCCEGWVCQPGTTCGAIPGFCNTGKGAGTGLGTDTNTRTSTSTGTATGSSTFETGTSTTSTTPTFTQTEDSFPTSTSPSTTTATPTKSEGHSSRIGSMAWVLFVVAYILVI